MAQKLNQLESCRGIAALMVVLSHFHSASPVTENALITNAKAVDFFFVLSGFVMALNYSRRIGAWSDLWAFMKKRFWRLYPMHLAMIAAYVAFETAQWVMEQHTGVTGAVPAFKINNFGAILANLALVQAIILPNLTLNGPSWSISTEFYTYLIFGALLLLPMRRVGFVVLWIVAALVMVFAEHGSLDITGSPDAIFRCLYSFVLGVGCYTVYEKYHIPCKGLVSGVGALVALALFLFWGHSRYDLIASLAFAAMIPALAQMGPQTRTCRVLCARPLVFLGKLSYSIYMVHFFLWQCVNIALRVVHVDPRTTSQLLATAIVLTAVGAVILISYFTYEWIERPWLSGPLWRTQRSPSVAQ